MMKFLLYLFVFVFLSNICWAEWLMPFPGVCEKTPEAIKSLLDEKYKPLIYSAAEPEKKDSRINVVVWTNSDDEILVTVSRMNYNLTCIVGLGDKNTTWVGIKKDEKNKKRCK